MLWSLHSEALNPSKGVENNDCWKQVDNTRPIEEIIQFILSTNNAGDREMVNLAFSFRSIVALASSAHYP